MASESDRQLEQIAAALPYVSARMRLALLDVYYGMQQLAPPEQRMADQALDEGAAIIERGYYRLLRLAGNLSSADRFAHYTPLRQHDDDLAELCRRVCKRARPLMKECKISLRFSTAPKSIFTTFDSAAMERVLLNLLSNSMKAMPKGGNITVNLRLSADQKRAILTVCDDGVGLDKKRDDPLFSMQLNLAAAVDPYAGLGVGLALCRNIMEAHDGSIVLSDAPSGKGTQVTVSLPILRQKAASLRDYVTDYMGGFDHALVELSDALPPSAFYQYRAESKNDTQGDNE